MPEPIDLRDAEPNSILEYKLVLVVAQRGYGPDWAAYWQEVPDNFPLHEGNYDMLAQETIARGNKLTEEAAKYNIFPQIGGGPYRA